MSELNNEDSNKNNHGSMPGTPRWVKVFGLIALVLIMLFVILHLTGLGFGGHAMHHGAEQL